jgi:hypothetical protein
MRFWIWRTRIQLQVRVRERCENGFKGWVDPGACSIYEVHCCLVEEPCGKAGWGEIFIRSDLKVAPITGVIWLALEKHVFDALFFGGGNNSTTELEKFEKRMETDEFDVYT